METRFAVCVDNSEYPASLGLRTIARVIPVQGAEHDGDLRVNDESNEDYLYPERYSVPIELPQEIERDLAESVERQ